MRAEGTLGEGSPRAHYPYLVNLAGLLLLESDEPSLAGKPGRFVVKKTGLRSTTFGNAAGGQWSGCYRYFLIELQSGEAQIVSMAVLGKMFVQNHPTFGNTSGTTMLVVAVDDFEKRHNSLQLDLDRFVDESDDSITLWHNGTLTRGKRGAAPRAEVLAHMQKRSGDLVREGRVQLGTVPSRKMISWSEANELLANLIDYALLRDEFRKAGG